MKLIPTFSIIFLIAGAICSCKNQATGNLPSSADTTVKLPKDTTIKPPTLAQLQSTKNVWIGFNGIDTYDQPIVFSVGQSSTPVWHFAATTMWQENSCITPLGNFVVSTSLNLIDSFKCNYGYNTILLYNNTQDGQSSTNYSFEGSNIPFFGVQGDTVIYSLSGSAVKDHLKNIAFSFSFSYFHGSWGNTQYISTDWNDTLTPPQIIIKFYK